MLARISALACACLFGLAAGASGQTQTAPPAATTPPAASAPAAAPPPADTPPAATPPVATPPAAAASPPAATPPATPTPTPAAAQAAPLTRIRGTIAAVAPHMLTINSRDGSKLDVTLADKLTVRTLKRVPLAAVANGAFVGIASRSGPKGTRVALEVLVFPEAMRGAGAGNYPWDLRPGSMMTNAPVTGVTTQRVGRDLTLTYQGGTVTIHVPPRAPVVTFVSASAADLKPGRKVFLAARKDADGHLSASAVTVGTHGVNPPM